MKEAIIPYTLIESMSMLDNIYEARLFGWMLSKAQSVLKLRQRELDDINIQHSLSVCRVTMPAKYLLPPGDTNYTHISRAFGLAKKSIHYERDGIEKYLAIIAFPEYHKLGQQRMVSFVIHTDMWRALLDFTRGYRVFSLPTILRLSSKYAIIMYLLISQQNHSMVYTIDYLRKLTGTDTMKAYDRGSNFIARVIEPARQELDRQSPFTFDYGIDREGRGGGYKRITIVPKANKEARMSATDAKMVKKIEEQRVRLDSRVLELVENAFYMTPEEVEKIEALILALGDVTVQHNFIVNVSHTCRLRRVDNPKGYLIGALKNARA